jgi:hypothetical protein
MVKCPKCGNEIRYITAAPSMGDNGIIPVDPQERELITETGRKVRGYSVHICHPPKRCTIPGMTTDICHAYNGGECMCGFDGFICGRNSPLV